MAGVQPEQAAAGANDLASAAEAALKEAQRHKRLANKHKRRARTAMAQFATFKADLEAMGIKVVIETPNHQRQEGGASGHHDGTA